MAAVTKKHYKVMQDELNKLVEALEEVNTLLAQAREAGDLSENEEYATARSKQSTLTTRISALRREINEAEIVEDDNSPIITIGSVVDVTEVSSDGTPLGETRRLTVESSGDTVIRKVLGVNSQLGSTILNGTSGIYRITNRGGIYYKVEKVIDEK